MNGNDKQVMVQKERRGAVKRTLATKFLATLLSKGEVEW